MKLRQGNSVSTAAITEENFQPVIDAFRMSGCKINASFNAENVKYFQFLEWHTDHLAKTNNIANGDMLLTVDQILGKAPVHNFDFSRTPNSVNDWHSRGELPPVGTECEAMIEHSWHKVEILKYKGDLNAAACLLSECYNGRNLYWSCDFRPLKTERERAIEEMAELMASLRNVLSAQSMPNSLAEALYDAGYRKGEK